jgi:ketosteroid isomerase-like protein
MFQAAFNAGRIEDMLALYEPSAVLAPAGGRSAVGLAAIRAAFTPFLGLGIGMNFRIASVLEAEDSLALVTAGWTSTHFDSNGAPHHLFGSCRIVLRRQPDGSWRYLIDDPGPGYPVPPEVAST